MRDNDKAKVYAGEHRLQEMLDRANAYRNPAPDVELFGTTVRLPVERKFASVESIQDYVDTILALDAVQEISGVTKPVVVRPRKGSTKAHYEAGTIAIPMGLAGRSKWALREVVVLHELAHHLAHDGHGPRFRYALAKLLEIAMAPEVGFVLQALWAIEGVN
jgi:putative metallohydrolase (TIGR04338 family)